MLVQKSGRFHVMFIIHHHHLASFKKALKAYFFQICINNWRMCVCVVVQRWKWFVIIICNLFLGVSNYSGWFIYILLKVCVHCTMIFIAFTSHICNYTNKITLGWCYMHNVSHICVELTVAQSHFSHTSSHPCPHPLSCLGIKLNTIVGSIPSQDKIYTIIIMFTTI